jgi:hypothetical protein
MSKEIVTVHKNIEHPLEDVFDIEPGTTLVTRAEQHTDLIVPTDYDEKDTEIEESIQEVYDKAMSGYERIQDECEDIEGRYLPRMMEVGVQHLKMALDAAEAKQRMKELKDKLSVKTKTVGPKTVNNNLVISREELLKTMFRDELDPDAP